MTCRITSFSLLALSLSKWRQMLNKISIMICVTNNLFKVNSNAFTGQFAKRFTTVWFWHRTILEHYVKLSFLVLLKSGINFLSWCESFCSSKISHCRSVIFCGRNRTRKIHYGNVYRIQCHFQSYRCFRRIISGSVGDNIGRLNASQTHFVSAI